MIMINESEGIYIIVLLREILFTKGMPGSKLNLPQISSMVLCGKQCKFHQSYKIVQFSVKIRGPGRICREIVIFRAKN